MRIKISPVDIIITAVILALAVALFLAPALINHPAEYVTIAVTGKDTERYSLYENKDIIITSKGITIEVKIENGAIYVVQSTCHDKICVRTGKITKYGQTIICAPAGVAITIEGGSSDADYVAG